jgi:acetyltransferase-like isoleucine patch superfamily enzyme
MIEATQHADAPLPAAALREYGLILHERGSIGSILRYERPTYLYTHLFKDCTIGAFSFCNSGGSVSAYRCHIGRYAQIGESTILGPPEHPQDWFSNHPFAFTRPRYMPKLYQLPDFARLAPDESDAPSYVNTQPQETHIGHEVYVGAGAFIKRGVTIGDGAVIGARSVVTRDVPPYAIVAGTPARVLRLRFADAIVERLLKLQWWQYDLAPFKNRVDWSQVEPTLDLLENKQAAGRLQKLRPATYELRRVGNGYSITAAASPLY